MLAESDFPIEKAIQVFAEFGVEATFLVPTQTGFQKSILDAHKSVRNYLKSNGIHDFESQGLGAQENGRHLQIAFVDPTELVCKSISLYRPKTKSGDPRIWTNIRGYAVPYNLLALVANDKRELFLINCSRPEILATATLTGSPLNRLLNDHANSSVSSKLISELDRIACLGWVDSTRAGDTAVGHTLESLLGIKANSSKRPDYLDEIEIKSGRRPASGRAKNRATMLSKVPNWKSSGMSAGQLLNNFGNLNTLKNRLELYVTVSDKPNRQGMFLTYVEDLEIIENRALLENKGNLRLLEWSVSELQRDLLNKHKETFWVEAESRMNHLGIEQFRYLRVTRTRRPMVGNLGPLINSGIITLDLTLSEKPGGGVRDHGYLFRIWPKHLHLIFPSIEKFELASSK